jgi:hypothetical protein
MAEQVMTPWEGFFDGVFAVLCVLDVLIVVGIIFARRRWR